MHTIEPYAGRKAGNHRTSSSRVPPPNRRMVAWLVAAALLSAGCSDISGNHAQVESARLFTPDGVEVTPQVEISDGDVLVVEARFYDAGGNELNLRHPEHAIDILFSPERLLHFAPVANEPFRRELSLRTPCVGRLRAMWIGYGHWKRADERRFGPFQVQPTDEVASVELFVSDSVQLTPDVKLPHGDTLRVEARFVGCDGEALEVPEDRELIFYWSDPELAEAVRVEGERFVYDVVVSAPVGTMGHVSLGYGTADRPAVRVIGPRPVEVVEPAPAPEPVAAGSAQKDTR